jgi:hypothetical protein
MTQNLHTIILLFYHYTIFSQSSFSKGKKVLAKSTELAQLNLLPSILLHLLKTALLDYTITNKFGNFDFKVKNSNPTILKMKLLWILKNSKIDNLDSYL